MNYEQKAYQEAQRWLVKMEKNEGLFYKKSKQMQNVWNKKIPQRFHQIVTESIKKMIQLSITSSEYIYKISVDDQWDLEEREKKIADRFEYYKKTAMVEGASTGAGGLFLGMADFPLLLGIKMKFLFDLGQLYGFDVKKHEERMFLLHLFFLTYSRDKKKQEVLHIVKNWDRFKWKFEEVDWYHLQQEYRDTLDVVKLFQLIPGFGAVVGVWANARLLEQLKETAMNASRLRLMNDNN
ncbi:EcsC family protein [Bacillaceae bacterium S4-13-56]